MKIEIEGNVYPTSMEDIENFEKKYNLNLPQDYKEFLLLNNGATPLQSKFITRNGKVVSHYKYIIPITKDTSNTEHKHNLEYCYIRFVVRGIIPQGLVPIGETPTENILCLSLRKDDYGSVYYWDRELELVYKQPQSECYHIIADSFKEFILGLKARDAILP